MSKSVLIADDHDIIRTGIRNILHGQSDYEVVAEAVDGEEVLTKVKELKPDILLLDITMPKISGLDVIEPIHQLSPETKIIIITVHKAHAYIMKALKAGVKGYLHKENAGEDLLSALHKVATGKVYLSSTVSSYLVDKISGEESEEVVKEGLLTDREEDILRLVVEGKTAEEIAKILYISRGTAETHKKNIFKKLGLHKTSDLIKYAVKHKIVDIEEY
ncbi:MAG: response regulator transcription factor [Candidatus Omnitrophica bacterium]|nr:response regulator transcription factor [Candidatus Omnitrophota bacterium]